MSTADDTELHRSARTSGALPAGAFDQVARSLHALDAHYREGRREPAPDPIHSLELARTAVEVLRELGLLVTLLFLGLPAGCTVTRQVGICHHDAAAEASAAEKYSGEAAGADRSADLVVADVMAADAGLPLCPADTVIDSCSSTRAICTLGGKDLAGCLAGSGRLLCVPSVNDCHPDGGP